ncbi:hypothetical protein FOA52_015926 [Chlamydomonas sp. UWO 241]|nr:hypothetical protein FOA52_015926 [Chlamydomonas sp. UWO 241]
MPPGAAARPMTAAGVKHRKNTHKKGFAAGPKASKQQEERDASCSENYSDSDDEGSDGYKKGGYHPVSVGQEYNGGRYTVLRKLGWGHFSTVWLVLDRDNPGTYGAMKVQKSATHYTEAARDEITLLRQIATGDPDDAMHCCRLTDSFEHSGPHGRHVCMVFEVLGDNLLALIKRFDYKGIPLPIVRNLARQMLIGLDYIHSKLNIIHTDFKPENVMLIKPLNDRVWELPAPPGAGGVAHSHAASVGASSQAAAARARAAAGAALGGSGGGGAAAAAAPGGGDGLTKNQKRAAKKRAAKKKATGSGTATASGTASARALSPVADDDESENDAEPAAVGAGAAAVAAAVADGMAGLSLAAAGVDDNGVDAGAAASPSRGVLVCEPGLSDDQLPTASCKLVDFGNACWTHKQFTADVQTRQYRSPEVILAAKYSTPCDLWSFACMIFEMVTGDLLFDPRAGENYDRDEDHLALFVELLGKMPRKVYERGKHATTYFNRNGELRRIKRLKFWPLEEVLAEKYKMGVEEAASLASFLKPMLEFIPERRATAGEMLSHGFLRGETGSSGGGDGGATAGAGGSGGGGGAPRAHSAGPSMASHGDAAAAAAAWAPADAALAALAVGGSSGEPAASGGSSIGGGFSDDVSGAGGSSGGGDEATGGAESQRSPGGALSHHRSASPSPQDRPRDGSGGGGDNSSAAATGAGGGGDGEPAAAEGAAEGGDGMVVSVGGDEVANVSPSI